MRTSRRTAASLLAAVLLPLLPAVPVDVASADDGEVVVARTAPAQPGEQTLVATVEQVVREREAGSPEEESTVLVTSAGRREVAGDVLADVPPGSTLEVTVAPAPQGEVRVLAAETTDAPAPVATGTPTVAPATHVATPTVTTSDPRKHDVYVVMQAPLGTSPDAATATVRTAVERAADFWTAETGGAIDLNVVQVVGWNTTATVDCSNTFAVWNEAETRSAFRPGRSKHLLVYTPRASSCAYGVGTVGGDPHAGGVSSVRALDQSLIAHELGHNLSLGHSGALTCGTSDAAWSLPLPSGCSVDDYGDYADVMGASGDPVGLGSLNVLHLQRLGVLAPATPVLSGTSATRTVVLSALSSGASPSRAVQVVDPKGDVYWLEHRSARGRDLDSARISGMSFGVRVLKRHRTDAGASVVLDGSPTGRRELDRALSQGMQFRSASGWTTVTVDAATAATASVTVRLADPAPPVPPSPTTSPTSSPTASPSPTVSPTPSPTVSPTPSPSSPPAPVVVSPPAPPAPAPPAPAPPAPAPPAPAPAPLAPGPVAGPPAPAPAPVAPAPVAPAPEPLTVAPEAPALAPVVAAPVGPPTAQPTSEAQPVLGPAAPAAPAAPAPAVPVPAGTSAPGTRPFPARLVLDAPDRTSAGSVYDVRGTVLDDAGRPLAGAAVQLLHQSAGGAAWTRIRTATTDARGAVSFSVRAAAGASYRLASADAPAAASPVERVQVAAALALGSVPATARAGRPVAVTGRTTAAPGTVVAVEVTAARRVVRRVAATVLPDGRLRAGVVLPRGTYGVRLARRTTAALLGGTTAARTLRVR